MSGVAILPPTAQMTGFYADNDRRDYGRDTGCLEELIQSNNVAGIKSDVAAALAHLLNNGGVQMKAIYDAQNRATDATNRNGSDVSAQVNESSRFTLEAVRNAESTLKGDICDTRRDVLENRYALGREIVENRFQAERGFADTRREIAKESCETQKEVVRGFGDAKLEALKNTNAIQAQIAQTAQENAECCCAIKELIQATSAKTDLLFLKQEAQTRQLFLEQENQRLRDERDGDRRHNDRDGIKITVQNELSAFFRNIGLGNGLSPLRAA